MLSDRVRKATLLLVVACTASYKQNDEGTSSLIVAVRTKSTYTSGLIIGKNKIITSSSIGDEDLIICTTGGEQIKGVLKHKKQFFSLIETEYSFPNYFNATNSTECGAGQFAFLLGDSLRSIEELQQETMYMSIIEGNKELSKITAYSADFPELNTLQGAPVFNRQSKLIGLYDKIDFNYSIIPIGVINKELPNLINKEASASQVLFNEPAGIENLEASAAKISLLAKKYTLPLQCSKTGPDKTAETWVTSGIKYSNEGVVLTSLTALKDADSIHILAGSEKIALKPGFKDVDRDLGFLNCPIQFDNCLLELKAAAPQQLAPGFLVSFDSTANPSTKFGIVSTTLKWFSTSFQTDHRSAISNLGGIVFNEDGLVLGINYNLQYSKQGLFEEKSGVSFSIIPEYVIKSFDKTGQRIIIEDISSHFFGVRLGKDMSVEDIVQGSDAQKIGLQTGDIVLMINNQKVSTPADFRNKINIDTELIIKVRRGAEELNLK
ncbi:MAG: serine protease [Planctomycetes bacterium]|nr:serine protease [Planctomycetota bacterium]